MKYLTFLIFIFILFYAYETNPTTNDFVNSVKQEQVNQYWDQTGSQEAAKIITDVQMNIYGTAFLSEIHRENYLFFSTFESPRFSYKIIGIFHHFFKLS